VGKGVRMLVLALLALIVLGVVSVGSLAAA
jgi:hypothetical protein